MATLLTRIFVRSRYGVLVAFGLALLVLVGIGVAIRSPDLAMSPEAARRTVYILGCVAYSLFLRANALYHFTYPSSQVSELYSAILFSAAMLLSASVFEGTFNYAVPLFYGCLVVWVVWSWTFSKSRDREFGSAMNYLTAGWLMLSLYLTLGQKVFHFADEPMRQLKALHPLLDLRLIFLVAIVAVLLVQATISALAQEIKIGDLIVARRDARGWFAPLATTVADVLNTIWRTVMIMGRYMILIGHELGTKVRLQILRLGSGLVAALLMVAFFVACWLIRYFVDSVLPYLDTSMREAWLPFALLSALYVGIVVWGYLMNRLPHATFSRRGVQWDWDREGWLEFSQRYHVAPSFLMAVLWFSALSLFGLSLIENLGLPTYRTVGPFVIVISTLIVVGLAYLVIRKREEPDLVNAASASQNGHAEKEKTASAVQS